MRCSLCWQECDTPTAVLVKKGPDCILQKKDEPEFHSPAYWVYRVTVKDISGHQKLILGMSDSIRMFVLIEKYTSAKCLMITLKLNSASQGYLMNKNIKECYWHEVVLFGTYSSSLNFGDFSSTIVNIMVCPAFRIAEILQHIAK
jgi:hypothetical protein